MTGTPPDEHDGERVVEQAYERRPLAVPRSEFARPIGARATPPVEPPRGRRCPRPEPIARPEDGDS
jgi:hypothetical protein